MQFTTKRLIELDTGLVLLVLSTISPLLFLPPAVTSILAGIGQEDWILPGGGITIVGLGAFSLARMDWLVGGLCILLGCGVWAYYLYKRLRNATAH